MIRELHPAGVLDAGCAQPLLVRRVIDELGIPAAGCDLSDEVMARAALEVPAGEFHALDLARETWPGGRKFDLVVCAETLEHIEDWRAALGNVVAMARRHVIVTVPRGRVRRVDELMGHYRHFEAPEIERALRECGCTPIRTRAWGFPVHSAYRAAVERFGGDRIYAAFAEDRPYSASQRLVSNVLYGMFFANDLFRGGSQLIVLARRDAPAR
jgi:SAM-dependent methyltransferase